MKLHESGHVLVDDDFITPPQFGTGYQPRDYQAYPLNHAAFMRAPTVNRLTKAEIIEAIKEKTEKKTWISDLCDRVGSHVKNQSQSSYCWAHAPTRGCECAHVLAGGSPLTFSAFYTAWPIKHGSNSGGSGVQAVHSLAQHGTCVESMVPPMTFHVKETPEIIANAALHKIVTYEEFEPGDYEAIWSSIVQDQPVTVGIPAWGHEVLLTFLVLNGSDIAEGFDNSWGTTFGKNGRGVLAGAKRRFDEAGRIAAILQSAA